MKYIVKIKASYMELFFSFKNSVDACDFLTKAIENCTCEEKKDEKPEFSMYIEVEDEGGKDDE